MKKTIIAVMAIAILGIVSSCKNEAIQKVETNNNSFHVELLFEVDGTKVYRFEDGGYSRYFTTKGDTFWNEKHGKTNVDMQITDTLSNEENHY